MITVTIPVGPDPAYLDYLPECVASIVAQTRRPDEVLIIDDQAHLHQRGHATRAAERVPLGGVNESDAMWWEDIRWRLWETPWLSGVAHSFNFGVALALNDLVIQLGSDDVLKPWAIEDCLATWERFQNPLGYYWMDVEKSTGETQALPCHAAMVHKDLWRKTGGWPVHSAVGAPDHIFISMMMAQKGAAGDLIQVRSAKPPYWYRVHDHTWTSANKAYYGAVALVRDQFTLGWKEPTWTR